MIARNLAAAAAVLAMASAASASPGIIMRGGLMTSVARGTGIYTRPSHHDGATVIFSNIGTKYPLGLYFCCSGATVSGPDSVLGFQSWPAMQFTPSADATVTQIDAAVEWVSGTNEIDVDLYADSNGVPGTLLKAFTVTGLESDGGCCSFAVGRDKHGVAVTGGTPYWVAVTTDANGTDTFASWEFNSTDQLDALPSAVNKGAGWVTNGGAVPAASFAVYGN